MMNDLHAVQGPLEVGRLLARITSRELWLRYLGLGGDASPVDVDAYLAETRIPNQREYNLLVDALNERLTDLGGSVPLKYAV